jgi:carbohydrate-selective porin OprB
VGLRLDRYYGDSLEVEHQHTLFGQGGVVRLLGYRNREYMGRFDDAVAALAGDPAKNSTACAAAGLFNYYSLNGAIGNPGAPDLCWARKDNVKVGFGLDFEQRLTDWLGVFARAMYSDGQTEVQAYSSTDRSLSLGLLATGAPWGRPQDSAGIATSAGFLSQAHADYLARGGIDGFIGDGALTQAAERNFEVFYSLSFLGVAALSVDYQRIWNPGFNADRGPVHVFGVRLHAQY